MLTQESFFHHLKALVPACETSRFLLAVSGGKDSVVMASLFHACGLHFQIAHCNFHLRGTDSDDDMAFVESLAAELNVTLHIKEFDTLAVQKNSGRSIEMTARELRYDWFRELAPDFDFVVTAHHADDNAETLLLNLARGTGLRGLLAIPEVNGAFLRPLLPFSSADIADYAQKHQIAFRTDQSNFSEQFHRNKIRLSVLPKLKEINPEVVRTLSQDILNFKQLNAFVSHQLDSIFARISRHEGDELHIDIPRLQQEEDCGFVLYELLRPYGFDSSTIAEILRALSAQSGKLFHSASHQLLKDRQSLIVKPIASDGCVSRICSTPDELSQLGFQIEYGELEPLSADAPWKRCTPDTLWVDADKFLFPVEIRSWRDGDKFVPFGMRGQKKISDLFNDLKIDRFGKKNIPILCSNQQIAWIVGVRADNRFRIDKSTNRFYKIKYYGRIGK